jgi:glycosyltransferase involved in cell wall biosynthesis
MLDPWFSQAYLWKHIKKTVFWRLIEHRVLRDARSVLFTCEAERQLAREAFRPFRCDECVIGMGTASPPDAVPEQLGEFYQAFPGSRGHRNILFLSRIHRKKGCDLLIRAFARVAGSDHRFRLIIAGPDEEGLRPRLERLARELGIHERLTWTGHLQGAARWGAFRAAEVFALPSHSENYGHAVVEAMACELPVLITNKVNIWNEISASEAGIVAPDDLNGVCELLSKWISLNEDQRKTLTRNARQCFSERFEVGAFARRFASYLETAKSKPSESQTEAVANG